MATLGMILSLIIIAAVLYTICWIVYRALRRGSRQCPRCGRHVKNGVMSCHACGFDFTTIGSTS